jgi:glycosyltransferase involved in cell wall biosynthesis/ribosomal protein S18 acetylase RimI-like enzyme
VEGAVSERSADGPVRVAHVTTVDMTHRFLLMGQLRHLRAEGFDVTAISAPGPHVNDIEAEGIHHIAWPHATRSWDPGADVRAFRELVAILREGRFHVVHTHNPKPGVMGRLAARVAGVPVVVNTVHGFYATPDDPLARRIPVLALEWLAARFSDLELYQSGEDLRWARCRGVVSSSRSRYLGNGADLSRFDPSAVSPDRVAGIREELGIPAGAPVVGTIGRMVEEKGYREFFEAARRIRRASPEVRFLAIGETDQSKPDAIGASEISERSGDVVFAGWRTDVPELLALMDVFVLASWREGFPRSAIEAAAMGRPLVLTDIRGCREVVRDGTEGFLVPPRDPDGLTDAVSRLLREPELRRRLGEAARERALERFDERRVADTVTTVYRSLLERKGLVARTLDLEGLRDVRIRRAKLGDLSAMARLHSEVLPSAFMPMLGERFLRRLFRAHVEDPGAVAVVAERDGEVIGYAAGVLSTPSFRRRFLLRHGIPAVIAAAPRLLRSGAIRRVLENASYPEMTRGFPKAEFDLVGVRRGTAPGLGVLLGREVLVGLAERGADRVKGYVAADNRAMNAMVRRMGFRLEAQVSLHDGKPSNIWVIGLESVRPSGRGARGTG